MATHVHYFLLNPLHSFCVLCFHGFHLRRVFSAFPLLGFTILTRFSLPPHSEILASMHVIVDPSYTLLSDWTKIEQNLQYCFYAYGIKHVTISPESPYPDDLELHRSPSSSSPPGDSSAPVDASGTSAGAGAGASTPPDLEAAGAAESGGKSGSAGSEVRMRKKICCAPSGGEGDTNDVGCCVSGPVRVPVRRKDGSGRNAV
jgi:hypothetical protein